MAAFLPDGYQTLISFARLVGGPIMFREKEVHPPALNKGGPIDTTTMRNSAFRTKYPKQLTTVEDITIHAEYDPGLYSQATTTLLGIITVITITFPDGSSGAFEGWLESIAPPVHKEGDFPICEMKVCVSNQTAAGMSAGLADNAPPILPPVA